MSLRGKVVYNRTALDVPGGKFLIKKRKSYRLEDLERTVGWLIYEAKSVFPFDLFPNEITICLNRVTIVERGLFFNDEYPLPIESIVGARVYRSSFFASLHVETVGLDKPPVVKHMRIKEARMARRYILALIECDEKGVDLSSYTLEELKEKLANLGKVVEGR